MKKSAVSMLEKVIGAAVSNFSEIPIVFNINQQYQIQNVLNTLYGILSQANNNHNPNNKTTITVVGLKLINRWEPPPPPSTYLPPQEFKTT